MSKAHSQVVVVVGASSGIGAALARRLGSEARKVALVARRADRLEQLAASINDQVGTTRVFCFPHDVTRTDEAEKNSCWTLSGRCDTL